MPAPVAIRWTAWLALAGCCLATEARAQAGSADAVEVEDEAERKARAAALDREARQAFEAGDFARAAELFAEANATLPHPATRYNEAVARERAGQLARAANLLDQVLGELSPSDPRHGDASRRLKALASKLGRLSLTTSEPATASIAFVRERAAPFVVYLEPGKYPLHLEFQSGARERTVELRPGELLRLDIDASPRAEPPAAPPAQVRDTSRTTWGLVTLGAGAAAGVAAGALGYSTLRALDDFETSGNTDAALRERAVRFRALTNVALGVAVVASGVGVYLLLSSPERAKTGSVALRLRLDGAELATSF